MTKNLVVVMNDITTINPKKDTSLAFLLEGQRRGYALLYLNPEGLYLSQDQAWGDVRPIEVFDDPNHWAEVGDLKPHCFGPDDVVMMRQDPPVDAQYLYATWVLDRAQAQGAQVINDPNALRHFNEKLAITYFGQWMPPTLVSASHQRLKAFVETHGQAVLKPLDGMGGRGIFKAEWGDSNLNAMLETLTGGGAHAAMAQGFLPEIADGDKRVLVIQGEIVPVYLARIPGGDDFRGNLARGGRGEGREVSDVERAIVADVGPFLVKHGILFAGLDVIGDRLTEINITSPTCVRELDQQFDLNIAQTLFEAIEAGI